ncbi:MAG: GNAT family protein, partial [Acidobacteriota bacterium]
PVNWRHSLPVMCGVGVTLRELRLTDAVSLHEVLTAPQVARFISPPPSTVDGFERFVVWTQRERAHGRYACFGVVPDGSDVAVGLFQLRQLEPGFGTAEWGFALAEKFWGSGLFVESARLVADFAFDIVGVHRLEARAAVANGRGNGAIQKLGATRECILRKSFLRRGEYLDQFLWTILDDDWSQARAAAAAIFH